MRLDPLRRTPQRGDVGLHLRRVLVDRRLHREVAGHRDLAADIFVPDRFVSAIEQQRSPALLLRLVQKGKRTHEHIDLLAFERAEHGVDIAGADPGDFLGQSHRLHIIRRPDVVGAAERGHRDDRLAAVGPLPFSELLQRGDALIPEILADDEHHGAAAGVGGQQDSPWPPVIGELHRMGNVADANNALRRGDDLTRLDAAAALDELAVEAGVLEVAGAVGDELRLIDRHGDGIDGTAAFFFSPNLPQGEAGATGDHGQRRPAGDEGRHHACSFTLLETLSSAASTASPISLVESFRAPGSAISAVLAPLASARSTAFSSRSASSGRSSVMRSIMITLWIEPSGLAMPRPAMSGALPCTGSYSALRRP